MIDLLKLMSESTTAEKIVIFVVVLVLSLLVGLFARKMMHRSVVVWTVLSMWFTPLVAFFFLIVAGRPREIEDEVRDLVDAEEEKKAADDERCESKCPSCGAAINLATRKGITASGEEPWKVSCAKCSHELKGTGL